MGVAGGGGGGRAASTLSTPPPPLPTRPEQNTQAAGWAATTPPPRRLPFWFHPPHPPDCWLVQKKKDRAHTKTTTRPRHRAAGVAGPLRCPSDACPYTSLFLRCFFSCVFFFGGGERRVREREREGKRAAAPCAWRRAKETPPRTGLVWRASKERQAAGRSPPSPILSSSRPFARLSHPPLPIRAHPPNPMSQVFEPLYYGVGAVAGVVEGLSR